MLLFFGVNVPASQQQLPKPDSLKNYLFGDAKLIKKHKAQAKNPSFLRFRGLSPTVPPDLPQPNSPAGHPALLGPPADINLQTSIL
jgi:hypothetical protein